MQNDVRYPIGEYIAQPFSIHQKVEWLAAIKFLPEELEAAVANLSDEDLDQPYREGAWTIRQLVHHLADSHLNAYCRFKLGLTEENPVIKPYNQNLWADLPDAQKLPIDISIQLLKGLHNRWHEALKFVTDNEWNNRSVYHPEHKKLLRLWFLFGMYAWHGKHHVAQIQNAPHLQK